MNNNNALQLRTDTMEEWGIIREKAAILVKSSFLPSAIKTPEQALAIILTGRELGIGDMQALNNINIIAGKPTIPPQLMLALINRAGELENISITDDGQACTVMMKRRGRTEHAETFSMKDAALMKTTDGYGDNKKTISLSEKYNWKQMPAVMRKWRAVAACARVVFPDVILGLYTPDEMGAATDGETGEAIEATQPFTALPDGEVVYEAEPEQEPEALNWPEPKRREEPVRSVSLEGVQPAADETTWPNVRKYSGVFAKLRALKWTCGNLADEIHTRFALAVSDEDPQLALDALSAGQLKELDQTLAAEFNNRKQAVGA